MAYSNTFVDDNEKKGIEYAKKASTTIKNHTAKEMNKKKPNKYTSLNEQNDKAKN